MDEFTTIRAIAESFTRSPDQENKLFESDAEVFSIGPTRIAITTDEFCEEEDGFRSNNIEQLGWNLAVATISDLVATGADPAFFLQVVCLPESNHQEFGVSLMRGLKVALDQSSCRLLGGDTSSGRHWRYVGTAIGTFEGEPIFRTARHDRLMLYSTGNFGDGNLSALRDEYQARFELRHSLMSHLRPHIGMMMDTSDGLRNTLVTLCMVNPDYRLTLEASCVPIHPDVKAFCESSAMPPQGFLLGSGGEYELVIGVLPDHWAEFEQSCKPGEVTYIGMIEKSDQPGLFWKPDRDSEPRRDIPLSIDPRFEKDRSKYVAGILEITKRLFS